MPAHKHPPRPPEPPRRVVPLPTPPRDLDVVDPDTRSYRVRLYRYLLFDSEAHDPDPNDPRLALLSPAELAEQRPIAWLVADRRRIYDALHNNEPVVIPRWRVDSHIWNSEIAHVPWLVDRSVEWFEVSPDDIVAPADGP